MKINRLIAHPDTPPCHVEGVSVELIDTADSIVLTYIIHGQAAIALPPRAEPSRRDGLWRTTCCEIFLKPAGGEAYVEYNFAPSGDWAAYRFGRYRAGAANLALAIEPDVRTRTEADRVLVEANVDRSAIARGPLLVALSAVIEEAGGVKSYWALHHPRGAPDFHHPDCFTMTLAAPERS